MELFSSSCGAGGPLRLEVSGPGFDGPARFDFDQPCVLVGRVEGNDLRLEHGRVSRRHAYLQLLAGRLFCLDLASRTGVWWGGRRCAAGWVEGEASVGPFTVRAEDVDEGGEPWDPLATPTSGQPGLPRVVLEVSAPGGKSAWAPVGRVLTLVGRDPACRLRVPDGSVSRFHAGLVLTAAGLWAVDLLSREGIRVNGERVRWARVNHGDEVAAGRVRIRPWYDPSVRSSPPLAEPAEPPLAETAFPLQPFAGALAALPPEASSSELPLLIRMMMQQFGLMQQQMMEQFQQGMHLMAQTFSNLHREQTAALREELAQVSRLTRELQSLQAALASGAYPPVPQAPTPGSPPPEPVESVESVEAMAPPAEPEIPATPEPVSEEAPVEEEPAGEEEPPELQPGPFTRRDVPSGAAAKGVGRDPHAWLTQRIAALERERASRWKKILGFMTGK